MKTKNLCISPNMFGEISEPFALCNKCLKELPKNTLIEKIGYFLELQECKKCKKLTNKNND